MPDITPLKQVPLFSQMDDQELAGVRAIMDEQTFQTGEVIMREGETGDLFYVVTHGQVQIIIRNAAGEDVVLNEVGAGGFFGELSMLTNEPRSARVRAMEPVTVLALERAEFFDFLQKYPGAAVDVLIELGKRQHRTDALLRQSVSRNVNEVDAERLTFGQRVADTVASTMGSWPFIIVQSTFLAAWITLNVAGWISRWDPYPFILLNLMLSFQAAYAAPFIMMSQNRQSAKDRLSAEIDHQVNAKAELEIGMLLRRVDEMEHHMRQNHEALARVVVTLKDHLAGSAPLPPSEKPA